MKKTLIRIVAAIIALAVLALALDGMLNRFKAAKGLFGHRLGIEETSNIITRINRISEFTTACCYDEQVIRKEKFRYINRKVYPNSTSKLGIITNIANPYEPTIKLDSTRCGLIVFIVKARVRAGFDLSKVTEEDVSVSGDTLSVRIPEAEVFDIIANPSDWEVFYSDGNWEDGEIRAIQTASKETLRQGALDSGLLERAERNGKESLVSLLRTFGFAEVVLR